MIDAHCHLNDEKYTESDLDIVLERAAEADVKKMICNGAGIRTSSKAISIAQRFDGVYATVGIHPEEGKELNQFGEKDLKTKLLDLCRNPKVVAIGEAGLDYKDPSMEEIAWQKRIFDINLWLCRETGLPLVVHNRNADADIKKLLENHRTGVQLHCFVQDRDFLKWAISKNYYISFGGVLTFKKSEYLRNLARECPRQSVLIETDSPYLAPEPKRGTRNEPSNVKIVAQTLASIWKTTYQQVDEITTENTTSLFTKTR